MAQARLVKKEPGKSTVYPEFDSEADGDFATEEVTGLTARRQLQTQAAPSPAVPNSPSGSEPDLKYTAAYPLMPPPEDKLENKEALLSKIIDPFLNAIARIDIDNLDSDNVPGNKQLEDMVIAIAKIKVGLVGEFDKLWNKQQKSSGKVYPIDQVKTSDAYKNMVKQAEDVRELIWGVVNTGTGKEKDAVRKQQFAAIEKFEKQISLGSFIKESLKRLFMILLGAAAGFASGGYLTMDPNAATTANLVCAGPIVGAVAGAALGNYLYKHGRFFSKRADTSITSSSIISKEYRLANSARAYVDATNPAEGVVAKVGRGMRKVF